MTLRGRVGIEGVGLNKCRIWADSTFRLLEEERGTVFRGFEIASGVQFACGGFAMYVHHWLQKQTSSGVYIADGTAGQFDRDYPNGFYSLVKEASKPLMNFYEKGPALYSLFHPDFFNR